MAGGPNRLLSDGSCWRAALELMDPERLCDKSSGFFRGDSTDAEPTSWLDMEGGVRTPKPEDCVSEGVSTEEYEEELGLTKSGGVSTDPICSRKCDATESPMRDNTASTQPVDSRCK